MIPRPDAVVANLYTAGLSLRQIGHRFGVSNTAIMQQLRKANVERRPYQTLRKPMFEIVMALARGKTQTAIAKDIGSWQSALCKRLRKIGAPRDLSVLLTLSPAQLNEYREALDVDRLSHADALELALEIEERAAA